MYMLPICNIDFLFKDISVLAGPGGAVGGQGVTSANQGMAAASQGMAAASQGMASAAAPSGGRRPDDLDINKFASNRPIPVPTPNRLIISLSVRSFIFF